MSEFWNSKSLAELTDGEWEALCDGCGRCCLRKLEDEETGEIFYTDVACRLLDLDSTRCRQYADRHELVADCVGLSRDRLDELEWMPSTCAYRLRAEGLPLPEWHPLISGDRRTVHSAGISVRQRVISETCIPEEELQDRLVDWVKSRR